MVGMGKDLADQFPAARSIYDQADRALGYSISQLCFEGPEADLTRTKFAQPAIFVTSLAALAALKEKIADLKPHFAAGLSLGEFSALVAAGSITFEDGLRLVKERAEAMEAAAQKHPGAMASVMGLEESVCAEIAQAAGCELANLNSPDQFVLSGSVETIDQACVLAEQRGAKRAMKLKVGGAFHSKLMQDAKERLEKALLQTNITAPVCTFIPNATAKAVSAPDEIRSLLAKQLTSPVRWIETMQRAKESQLTQYLEMGPGKVLKGLARKCQPDLQVEPCGTAKDIEKCVELLQKVGNPG